MPREFIVQMQVKDDVILARKFKRSADAEHYRSWLKKNNSFSNVEFKVVENAQ